MKKQQKAKARTQHQIFLEDSLWEIARILSRKYTKIGRPICGKRDGSASWYIRNAVIERMKAEGVRLDMLDLTDSEIYNIQH